MISDTECAPVLMGLVAFGEYTDLIQGIVNNVPVFFTKRVMAFCHVDCALNEFELS